MSNKKFHSSFVTDVSVGNPIVLTDSYKNRWQIDPSDKTVVDQFKKWMTSVFLKGVPQTLTVFEYEDRAKDSSDFDLYIVRFCNAPEDEKMVNG